MVSLHVCQNSNATVTTFDCECFSLYSQSQTVSYSSMSLKKEQVGVPLLCNCVCCVCQQYILYTSSLIQYCCSENHVCHYSSSRLIIDFEQVERFRDCVISVTAVAVLNEIVHVIC